MIVIYDIETLKNCFTCVAIDIATLKKYRFVIHKSRNDLKTFVDFVNGCKGMVGFNNVAFDYPVIHPFITMEKYLYMDSDKLARAIYKRAQKLIESETRNFLKPIVPQRDLFLVWHFNNLARSTSLKWLQICMGMKNVQEMPVAHDQLIKEDLIPVVLDYNENDVESTLEFYKRSKSRIRLRKTLSLKYGIDMGNFSDNKIGERIFLQGIGQRLGKSLKELKTYHTLKKSVFVRNILMPMKFSTKEFAAIYEHYQQLEITNSKKDDEVSCVLDGVKYEFGFGGLHGFRISGIYHDVTSADVSSYYPNLSIQMKLHPEHFGQAFCDTNESLYQERSKYPKGSDESTGLKLSLNGVIGMTNAEWSPFYDLSMFMSITLNGQFLLALLCERITLSGCGSIIMANTDGIEVDVHDKEGFERICNEWQAETKLNLEFSKYKLLAARDVNNYIAVYEDGKTKEKGGFEVVKELYKNQSMRIVPIAVRKYFTDNVPIEKTVGDCTQVELFFIGKRAKTGTLQYRAVDGYDLIVQPLPKNVRYFISRSGGSIIKVTKKKKKNKTDISDRQISLFGDQAPVVQSENKYTKIHVGYRMTLANKWIDKPFEEYQVEKRFYINEAQKLIDSVTNQQLAWAA